MKSVQFRSMVTAAILILSMKTSFANENDLVIVVAIKDDTTKEELELYLKLALESANNEKCDPTVKAVSERVYERFSRMMNRVSAGSGVRTDGTITEVKDELNHWHINTPGGITPKRIVLQMGNDKAESFPVQGQGARESTTAQEVSKNLVRLRVEDSWNIKGYRLEWENESFPSATEFKPWPRQSPTYVVVLRNFNDANDARERFFKALKDKVPEVLKVDTPIRPLKLVSIDMDPTDYEDGPIGFRNNYTISVPSLGTRQDEEPLAWVLFPVSKDEKDAVVKAIREREAASDSIDRGPLGRVADYIKGNSHGYEYVPQSADIASVVDLPTGMPQPTASLGRSLKSRWYEVPAQLKDNRRVRYARTLQLTGEDDHQVSVADRHWMVVVYARYVNGKWFAGQPSDIQKRAGSRYSTTIETKNFQTFYERLQRDGENPPLKKEETTKDAPKSE
jgi:hypothetical protein